MTVFQAAHQVDCIQAAERLGLQLKRSGSRCFANCVFHAENTPSMCLYPDDGGFYCFGCNEHGDAIRLYQKVLGISPADAAKRICTDFGLSYDRRYKRQRSMPYKLPGMTAYALGKKLTDWREKQVDRLLNIERIADQQMERIEADYAIDGKDITGVLDDPNWRVALQQKCKAQERIARLDSMMLPELLLQMKEGTHGKT